MRVVPAKNGWSWLVRGFALFRKSPPMWLVLVFTYWIAATLLGQIRYVGPAASTVLLPVFFVSFMVMCAVLDRGGLLRPSLLFSGFRSGLGTLIALGALSLVSIVVVLGIASLADSGALMALILSGQQASVEAMQDGSVLNAMLVAALAATPVAMAFWFAPVLVAWSRIGAAQSLFYSFFAVWRNWRAFFVYGAVLALAGGGFLVIFTFPALPDREKKQVLPPPSPIFSLGSWPSPFPRPVPGFSGNFPGKPRPAQ